MTDTNNDGAINNKATLRVEKGKYLLSDLDKAIKLSAEMTTKVNLLAAGEEALAGYDTARAAWDAASKTRTCNGLVKADITMFGEKLKKRFRYRMEQDCKDCDLLIVIGSSLQVMPFAGILGAVSPLCPRILINRDQVGLFEQTDPPLFFGNIGFR